MTDHIDFLEQYSDRLRLPKMAGYFQHLDKSVVARFRDIHREVTGQDWIPDLNCSGCDEVVDMVHHVYELYDLHKEGSFVKKETFPKAKKKK